MSNTNLHIWFQTKGKGLQARIQQMRRAVEELGLLHHFNYTNHTQGIEGLLVDNLMDVEFLLGDLSNVRTTTSLEFLLSAFHNMLNFLTHNLCVFHFIPGIVSSLIHLAVSPLLS